MDIFMTDPLMAQFGGPVADATGFSNDEPINLPGHASSGAEEGFGTGNGFSDNEADMTLRQGKDPCAYPECGAEDHPSFCQKKLVEMGIDKEYFIDVATDRTIQLDYDIPYEQILPQQFADVLDIFRRVLSPNDGKISTATEEDRKLPENRPRTAFYRHLKSRNGRTHVVISLSWDMPQAERIAWQAAFGSDFRREALSLAYAALGQHDPVLLYSRNEEVSLVVPIQPFTK
jgi:hypothetical protein